MTNIETTVVLLPWQFVLYMFISVLVFAGFIVRAKLDSKESTIDYILMLIALPETLSMIIIFSIQDKLDARKFDKAMAKLEQEKKPS